jgi:hypothetical protein
MKYIDPHIHCVSRTTDDYQFMAAAASLPSPSRRFGRGSTVPQLPASPITFGI